ncbi:helix-turn-helix transcriptional regulator [Candidatus Fermentibacterales bacterium]|nr:helix-turn-helix transcriptional regulator [Candidatus Fermentibacterales bacterium]
MRNEFGEYVRQARERLRKRDAGFSVRKLAERVGLEPSYLSKIERGLQAPPSAEKIALLAEKLGDDPDVLLALAGKVSDDLLEVIRKRPALFGRIIRELRDLPDHAVLRVVREVRDGEW